MQSCHHNISKDKKKLYKEKALPWSLSGKEFANAGNPCSIPGWGRFPGEGNGNLPIFAWKSLEHRSLTGNSS